MTSQRKLNVSADVTIVCLTASALVFNPKRHRTSLQDPLVYCYVEALADTTASSTDERMLIDSVYIILIPQSFLHHCCFAEAVWVFLHG